jgi:hypothetical protein
MRQTLPLFLVFSFAAVANASPRPPTLPLVRATLVEALEGYHDLHLQIGAMENCRHRRFEFPLDVTGGVIYTPIYSDAWTCFPRASAAVLSREDGTSYRFPLDTVMIEHYPWAGEWLTEFRFFGDTPMFGAIPPRTRAMIGVWSYDKEPRQFRGAFSIDEYNVYRTLTGTSE